MTLIPFHGRAEIADAHGKWTTCDVVAITYAQNVPQLLIRDHDGRLREASGEAHRYLRREVPATPAGPGWYALIVGGEGSPVRAPVLGWVLYDWMPDAWCVNVEGPGGHPYPQMLDRWLQEGPGGRGELIGFFHPEHAPEPTASGRGVAE